MKVTKELLINVGLAFLGGFVVSFGAFIAATPKNPGLAALISGAGAGLWAAFRAAVGFIALNFPKVPTIPVDE